MNFFLDTSALFKLFVQEDLSDQYLSMLQEDPSVHVSHISWWSSIPRSADEWI